MTKLITLYSICNIGVFFASWFTSLRCCPANRQTCKQLSNVSRCPTITIGAKRCAIAIAEQRRNLFGVGNYSPSNADAMRAHSHHRLAVLLKYFRCTQCLRYRCARDNYMSALAINNCKPIRTVCVCVA